MPHGTPDWGSVASQSTVKILLDVAELAARLGSPDTFDRGGNVIYLTSFEQGFAGMAKILNGTNAAISLSSVESKTGSYSAILTAGSDGTHDARLWRTFAFPTFSTVGFETAFKPAVLYEFFGVLLSLFDGATVWTGFVRHNQTLQTLEYYSSAGVWVTFATGLNWHSAYPTFHVIKMRANFQTKTFARCTADNVEYDLRGIPLQPLASADTPHQAITLTLSGRLANNDVGYVDDIIVTQNEPE